MKRGAVSLGVLLVVLLGLLCARGAQAQAESADARARIHFESGSEHFQDGDYEAALREFQAAFDQSHRPALHYNLYLCQERLGHYQKAADELQTFLGSGVHVENSDQLEARLANLRRRAAQQEAAQQPAAQEHAAQPVADAAARPAAQSGRSPSPAPASGGLPTSALVAFSVGAAGVVTYVVFGSFTLVEDGHLANTCGANRGRTCTDGQLSTLHTYAALADVGWIVALASGVTGGLLWLLTGHPSSDGSSTVASAWVDPRGGGGGVLRGHF